MFAGQRADAFFVDLETRSFVDRTGLDPAFQSQGGFGEKQQVIGEQATQTTFQSGLAGVLVEHVLASGRIQLFNPDPITIRLVA